MNKNNIYEQKHVYKNTYFEPEDWVIRKIEQAKKDHITNVYQFYKKFNLEDLGFIEAELTNQDSELLLRIKKYTLTYPNEWTMSMIRDATLFHLTLFEKLYSLNLALKSSSLQNIFFDNTKPKFSDLTTLTVRDEETLLPLSMNDAGLKNTVNKILLITELIKQNDYSTIRQILQEPNDFILNKKIRDILSKNKSLQSAWEASEKIHSTKLSNKKSFVDQCEYLYNLVISMSIFPIKNSYFSKDDPLLFNNISNWNQKQKNVYQIIKTEHPKTVLDINAGSGWNSFLAAREGASVIATDADELAIDNIYLESKKQNLKILSLFMPFSSMSKNISCDLVLCPEVDAIISKQNMKLDDIFKILCNVTKKTLILDFLSTHDQSELGNNTYPIDITINHALQYFKTVAILDTHMDSNKLLVFKK
ncbi:MAG: hypothetical protein V1646_02425 [bacterium]